ncbi:hypothetical protein VE04_01230 [Pseudogymnoascus sp. 24MN13]|nr:hypothetical protein VE04_01230 [Pseudogymnoascus sp. 24MN13]
MVKRSLITIHRGNSEPTFTMDVQVEVLDGSSIQNDFFVMNALCRGCRSWNGGSLNLSTTAQPFIYAVGPNGVPISSDSQTAGLRRHDSFGHFTMNMIQATGPGGVPLASNITSGATLLGSLVKDGDKASKAHGFLMALVALVIIPFDVIIIGLFKWPLLHAFTGSFVLFLVLTAMGLGIYVSTEYNRSNHFDSAHQVIGFLSVGGLLVLASIGIYLRRMQKTADKSDQAGQKNSKFTSIHTWGARCIWLLLIINNGLGMQFAGTDRIIVIVYSLLAVAMALPMLLIYFCIFRRSRKRKEEEYNANGGFQLSDL